MVWNGMRLHVIVIKGPDGINLIICIVLEGLTYDHISYLISGSNLFIKSSTGSERNVAKKN